MTKARTWIDIGRVPVRYSFYQHVPVTQVLNKLAGSVPFFKPSRSLVLLIRIRSHAYHFGFARSRSSRLPVRI
jgi:hypothetical protein